jgi:Flp pilus assembly pilin Flp
MLRRLHGSDRGASLVEYAAVILVIAVIAAAVIAFGIPRQIQQGISSAIECALTPEGDCTPEGAGDQPGGDLATQPEGDQGSGSGGDSDTTDPSAPGEGSPGGTDPDWGAEATPLVLDGTEGFEAHPLLYQPESGNGATPTHDSFTTTMELVRDDSGNRGDDGYETELTEDGTAGSDPKDDDFDFLGLGEPVEGSSLEEEIHPPEWTAPEAHNEHGSKEATEEHENLHGTWEHASRLAGAIGMKNARKNMNHYLENSGEPLEQDVDDMLNSVDPFKDNVEQQQHSLVETAIFRAMEEGGDGPYTIPVRTRWTQHHFYNPSDGRDWYYASGNWQYSQTGKITVTRQDDGSWFYEMEMEVHMRDQYDWHGVDDGDLGVHIPFKGAVPDEELADLARAGLAQEFTMYGTSDKISRSGTYTSDEGLHGEVSSGPGTGR